MSQGELLLLLFDEILKNIRKAEVALEEREYEIFDNNIDRTVKIIRYLVHTLDMSQEVAFDLNRIYQYCIMDFSRVKAGRDRKKDELPRLAKIFQDLRDGFEGASRQVADQHIVQEEGIVG